MLAKCYFSPGIQRLFSDQLMLQVSPQAVFRFVQLPPIFGFAMNMLCFYSCSNTKLPRLKLSESPSAWAMKSKF